VQDGLDMLVVGHIALAFPTRSAACVELTERKHPTARIPAPAILAPGNSFGMVSSCHSESDAQEPAGIGVIIP
jgi:hypothetical protein